VITRRVMVAAAAVLVVVSAGFYVVVRPYLPKHPQNGVRLPSHRSSNAQWVWPDGVPGWKPGERYKNIPIITVQPIEVEAARLAAARKILDPDRVRVLADFRPGYEGVYAILAAPTREVTPERTCLASLRLDAPVVWQCPPKGRIYAVVAREHDTVILVGVARGDVSRVVFAGQNVLYPKTWGEFSGGWADNPKADEILVYGHGRLLERIPVDLQPGQSKIVH